MVGQRRKVQDHLITMSITITAQEIQQHTSVLELPLSEFWRRYVNLEFLYGICLSLFPSPFSPRAAITSPSALRLLLMFCVSRRRSLSPAAPLFSNRSLPAKSTRFRLPSHASPVSVFCPRIRSVNTECDRDERSFISVAATVRRDCASESSVRTCAAVASGTTFASVTVVRPVFASCLISCFFLSNSPFPSRSLIVSLYYRGG